MDAGDSPFSTSFSILYFSVVVLVLSFLLQPATFDILDNKTKQQSFRRLYLFNFRTFEVSNHSILLRLILGGRISRGEVGVLKKFLKIK